MKEYRKIIWNPRDNFFFKFKADEKLIPEQMHFVYIFSNFIHGFFLYEEFMMDKN